jgi:hypothetical protein
MGYNRVLVTLSQSAFDYAVAITVTLLRSPEARPNKSDCRQLSDVTSFNWGKGTHFTLRQGFLSPFFSVYVCVYPFKKFSF